LIATKDDEWHELMLSACPNTTLLTQISKIRLSLHRYESLLVTEKVVVHRVATEHLKIAEYLQEGDIGAAQQALRDNWSNSVDRILERANIRYLAEDV
jgi:DNA-binding GntR family transcriptional regulator